MLILLLSLLSPPVPGEKPDGQRTNYDKAYKEAQAKGLPIVVYVGYSPIFHPSGCIAVRWDGYPSDIAAPCVVVGRGGKEIKQLPGKPSAAKIRAVWQPQTHPLPDMPHSSLPPQVPAVPRGFGLGRGSC
jgi:hypothetical protein